MNFKYKLLRAPILSFHDSHFYAEAFFFKFKKSKKIKKKKVVVFYILDSIFSENEIYYNISRIIIDKVTDCTNVKIFGTTSHISISQALYL